MKASHPSRSQAHRWFGIQDCFGASRPDHLRGSKWLLALALLFFAVTDVRAQLFSEYNGFLYNTNGAVVATITGYGGTNANITLPLTISNLPVVVADNGLSGSSFTSVTIPEGFTQIGNSAFRFCPNLTNASIPSTLTNLGSNPFFSCTSLLAVSVAPGNPLYSSADGIFYDKNQTTMLQYPIGRTGPVTFPPTVPHIGAGAFAGSVNLNDLTIPGTVTNLDDSSFTGCPNLTNVVIDINGGIGEGAFSQDNLRTVTIGSGVTSIGIGAFEACVPLARVSIANGVSTVGANAFAHCGLVTITFPASVKLIGANAFMESSDLTGVYFLGNAPGAYSSAFSYDDSVIAYYRPGTAGWSSSFAGVPALPWDPAIHASGSGFGVTANHFGFTVTGSAGLSAVVESSDDPAALIWTPLTTISFTGGAYNFTDPAPATGPRRFYRLSPP